MNTHQAPKIIFGAGNVGDGKLDSTVRFDTPEEVEALLDAFYARGYREIDTAHAYSPHAPGTSEPRLGHAKAGDRFVLGTKVAHGEGLHKKETVLQNINLSLENLQVKQLDLVYLHVPDRTVPFEETLEAFNEAYEQGKLKNWGISNYAAAEVEQMVDICDRNGWKRPSAYQGHYNPIVRGAEKELFPVLRKYNMTFSAYSPAAGGFFAGNHKNAQSGSRFDSSHKIGGVYNMLYVKPEVMTAADKAVSKATQHGIGGHAAAIRWVAYHSALQADLGDGIVIGASSIAQLETNLNYVNDGRLPDDVAEAFDAVYQQLASTEAELPYHF